jgi:RNA polymerase sigma factor (TIGR02999 family)
MEMLSEPAGTELIPGCRNGDREVLDGLLPQVYEELHRVAASYLRQERTDHTLQTTALVNEAYLRLARTGNLSWHDRSHFLVIAARIMRRILVDHGRGHQRLKRGGGVKPMPLEDIGEVPNPDRPDLLEIDQALRRLSTVDRGLAQVVELLFFGGLTQAEVAVALGMSECTVYRRWRTARALLLRYLR